MYGSMLLARRSAPFPNRPKRAGASEVAKGEPIRVTDHAVLRYMERVMGLNIEMVRKHIADTCAGPAAIGAVCVRAEGFRFEITNNTVVTVRPDNQAPSNTDRRRNQDFIQRRKQA